MAEQLICNQQVVGSTPTVGSVGKTKPIVQHGRIPERPKGTDCKSVGSTFEGSNPSPPIDNLKIIFLNNLFSECRGVEQLGSSSGS